jgi:hypothetical protein
MGTVHSREYEFIFSLNKQGDIATAVDDAQMQYQRSIRTFAPARLEHPAVVSDRQWYGKGHPYPTFWDPIQKWYMLDAQERSATNLELLYALAFIMGNVVTTQADSVTNPNEYTHTIKWQDTSTYKEALYTTVFEKMGAEYVKALTGVWLNSLTITGNRDDHVTMSFDGGARKYATDTLSSPGISTASFFKTLFGSVAFGLADSTADISAEVLSFDLTINQNVEPLWLMGNSAGEEDLVSRVLIGDQTVNGSFTILVEETHRDRFLNNQTCELQLELVSPDTIDTNPHSCTIDIHNLKITEESFGEEGSTVAYTLTLGEDGVLKTVADEHITATMVTNIDSTELLVASP